MGPYGLMFKHSVHSGDAVSGGLERFLAWPHLQLKEFISCLQLKMQSLSFQDQPHLLHLYGVSL